jgi:hypothetical protein
MGELHVKPTKAELAAKAKKALEDAERIKPSPSPSAPAPSPSEGAPSASPSPSEPVPSASPSPSTTVPSGSVSASPSPSAAPDDDEVEKAKKKASASAREAQVLHSRTKKYDEAVEEAEKVEPPTDEEMEVKYGKDEWEDMSEGSKQLAREAWVSNKRFEIMSAASKEGRDIEKWNGEVDKFIGDPKTLNKFPVLEGKQEDFKVFALKPTRRGLDFEDLVLAFKGDLADNPPKKNKGQMFEKGSPGRKDAPKPNDGKLSIEAGAKLKKTDYKKWKQMLKDGKIRQS